MKPDSSLRPDEAVGMKMKFALGPPARATNSSMTPVPKFSRELPAAPEIINAPLRTVGEEANRVGAKQSSRITNAIAFELRMRIHSNIRFAVNQTLMYRA